MGDGLAAEAGHPGTAAPVGDHGPDEPAAACPDHRSGCYRSCGDHHNRRQARDGMCNVRPVRAWTSTPSSPASTSWSVGRQSTRTRDGGHHTARTRPRTRSIGTAPNVQLSVELAGSSPSTQTSPVRSLPSGAWLPGAPTTRLTISNPRRSGCSITTTSPGRSRPAVAATAQSPGSSVGRIEGPDTSTRKGLHRRNPYAAAQSERTAANASRRILVRRW